MTDLLTIHQGDCRQVLKTLPDESVHCVVTSPPYFGLRDYGTAKWEGGEVDCDHKKNVAFKPDLSSTLNTNKNANQNHAQEPYRSLCGKCGASRTDNQLGLESTPAEYIAEMVAVFREVRRVLRSDGTLWLNIGDSYARQAGDDKTRGTPNTGQARVFLEGGDLSGHGNRRPPAGFKTKDLMMIPARLAIALCDDGWYLRSEIVWSKPNPMPESVTDRPTRSHEMVYLLTKSARYFYDAEAIKEQATGGNGKAYSFARATATEGKPGAPKQHREGRENIEYGEQSRNRRSVWTIPTQPTPDAHFATFPQALVEPCILAGTSARGCCATCGAPYKRILEPTPEYAKLLGKDWSNQEQDNDEGRGHFELLDGGRSAQRPVKRNAPSVCAEYVTKEWQVGCECGADIAPCTVLDPFAGSFTTGKVALRLGRRAIGIELNQDYIDIGNRKCQVTYGLALA